MPRRIPSASPRSNVSLRKRGLPFYKISSVTGEGIDALKRAMAEAVLAPPPVSEVGRVS